MMGMITKEIAKGKVKEKCIAQHIEDNILFGSQLSK